MDKIVSFFHFIKPISTELIQETGEDINLDVVVQITYLWSTEMSNLTFIADDKQGRRQISSSPVFEYQDAANLPNCNIDIMFTWPTFPERIHSSLYIIDL